MKNIIIEKSKNIPNALIIPSQDNFCIHCSNLLQNRQYLTCSNQDCSSKYCVSCLINFYQKNDKDINSFLKNSSLSDWKCPSCEGKCLSNKSKSSYHSSMTNETENGSKNNSFSGKKISSDAELIMWLSSNEEKPIDTRNVKFPFIPLNSKIKSKVFDKLIKIAKQCELFYRHKCKNEYIKKNCSNCFEINFHQNDLLRFFNYETFLYYMKYLFLVSNKIVDYSKENFNRNKNDFEQLFQRFKDKKEIWIFKDTKIICKQCMLFLINKPNFFENIKNIFLKREKKFSLSNNIIELNEQENNINNIDNSNNNEYFDSIEINSKKVFKIIKQPKNRNFNDKNNNNNIIINYNKNNNNIYNTLILNNEFKFGNFPFLGLNIFGNPIYSPFFSSKYNDLNNLSIFNSNSVQTYFLGLKQELVELLKMVDLSKINNNKVMYLPDIELINQKIMNYFKLIENSICSNLRFLNISILKNGIYLKNNIEFIEIRAKLFDLIIESKNSISLLNSLKFKYLTAINTFIKDLFQ